MMREPRSNHEPSRLAVYGTLAPGRLNHHHVSDLPGRWLTGQVRGRLSHTGWGAALGYPGLTLDPAGDPIEVFILQSAALAEQWPRLDAFEGPEYRRQITQALTAEGNLSTSIYTLAKSPIPDH